VRALGLLQVSRLLEALARTEQIRSQIGPPHVDAKTFDHAGTLDDGAAGLPERTPLSRTRLDTPFGGEAEGAGLWLGPAHVQSVPSLTQRQHPAEH
jgi:hypothetical protein